jgi:hypothetical protein
MVVRRPPMTKAERDDPWLAARRSSFVLADSFDTAGKLAVSHFNDLDAKEDYFVTGVEVLASTEEGEGEVLLTSL